MNILISITTLCKVHVRRKLRTAQLGGFKLMFNKLFVLMCLNTKPLVDEYHALLLDWAKRRSDRTCKVSVKAVCRVQAERKQDTRYTRTCHSERIIHR